MFSSGARPCDCSEGDPELDAAVGTDVFVAGDS